MSTFWQHLHRAWRSLARDRASSLAAVACLALGMGVNLALAGVVDRLYFRPPPHVRDGATVHRLYFSRSLPGMGERTSEATSYPNYQDLRRGASAFSEMGAFFLTEVSWGEGERARKAQAALVSGSFLNLLGVRPRAGRLFGLEEGEAAEPGQAVLLGEDFWRRSFAASPGVLGSRLTIGRQVFTVAGVLPRGFTGLDLAPVDFWLPLNAAESLVMGKAWSSSRGSSFLQVVGRRRSAVSIRAAELQASEVYRRVCCDQGELEERAPPPRVDLGPVQRAGGPAGPLETRIAAGLAALSGLLLLMACANVSNLLLARGWERQGELALRRALGAPNRRLISIFIAEGVLLALWGGVAALGTAGASQRLLQKFFLPAEEAGLDLRMSLWGTVLLLAAALLSAALPAAWGSLQGLAFLVRDDNTGLRLQRPVRNLALAVQFALTLVLLFGAGLVGRSLSELRRVRLGFDADRVLVVTTDLKGSGLPATTREGLWQEFHQRTRALPGVDRAALAAGVPLATSYAVELVIPGRRDLPELPTGGPYVNAVSADFFSTLGTRILRGRGFLATEPRGVVLVNATMAARFWPGQAALGQCLRVGGEREPCSMVIGLVEDARRSDLREAATMQYYVPLAQAPPELTSRALFLRLAEKQRLSPELVRKTLLARAPALPYVTVQSLEDLLAPRLRPWRMGAVIFDLFGAAALALAGIGVYGAVSQAVHERRRELGIRFALGADRKDLLKAVALPLAGAGAAGLGLGALLALAMGHALRPLLFRVSPHDLTVLGGAMAVVLLVAAGAGYGPAHRLHYGAAGRSRAAFSS